MSDFFKRLHSRFRLNKLKYLECFTGVTLFFLAAVFSGCAGMATSAEEYYSIGMAYFDLGKFDEAEKWLNRARSANRTMVASEYNLGRIAFETKRYHDAAKYFETVLKRDPDNVLALKAAAYTRIKTGELELAEKLYERLLNLVPESADNGYNHALVLYAMKRYGDAEKVLDRYPFVLMENSEMMLLYARCLFFQDKVEAIDSYAKWLENNPDTKDIKVRYEYAQILERNELYARALEEYRKTLSDSSGAPASGELKRSDLQFALARVLLIADSENTEGITELETAIKEGFADIEAVEELLNDGRISAANRDSLRNIVNNMQRTAEQGQDNEPETDPQDAQDNPE